MKKAAIPILLMLLLLPACSGDIDKPYHVAFNESAWNTLDWADSGFNDSAEFEAEVYGYIEAISDYCDRPDWYKAYSEKHGDDYELVINYIWVSGRSHVEHGYESHKYLVPNVYLKKDHLENGLAPIAHETTHILFPHYSALSYREGLASYMQDKFGQNPDFRTLGINVHRFAAYYHTAPLDADMRAQYNDVIAVLGTGDAAELKCAESEMRPVYYILSHSLTAYFIDNHGIQKFMTLYESDDPISDFDGLYGFSFNDARAGWLSFLESDAEPLSTREYIAYREELDGILAQ
ncbi:MAG: hypothetical protein LBV27_07675 [Oscillospiraceae bacterium]|jgi:hypothetical protein|nr:hypothetical protein [Oscillospiraceae bacterium]